MIYTGHGEHCNHTKKIHVQSLKGPQKTDLPTNVVDYIITKSHMDQDLPQQAFRKQCLEILGQRTCGCTSTHVCGFPHESLQSCSPIYSDVRTCMLHLYRLVLHCCLSCGHTHTSTLNEEADIPRKKLHAPTLNNVADNVQTLYNP